MGQDLLAATRDGWHRIAEHVVAAAQYADTGRIGLRWVAGGFEATQLLAGGRRVGVVGTDLVVTDSSGTRAHALSTVAAAAAFIGIEPGLPAGVYPPATPLEPDARLHLDTTSVHVLAGWYGLADAALRRLAIAAGDEATPIIWPEHFDAAVTLDSVNYGASPGDDHIGDPYLYVGPHAGPPVRDEFWNASFGAARTRAEISSVDDALAFFDDGRRRLAAS